MSEPAKAEEERYTYADLLTWPADERWELIDGTAYNMTPAPASDHQEIIALLVTQFVLFLRGKPCKVYPAPFDVRLPGADEDEMSTSTVLQPDITVVCDLEKVDKRGCLGSPTLVVEVLSPETATRDMREKFQVYERAGVPEYWVVSPLEQMVMVFTLDAHGQYRTPVVYGKGDMAPVGVLPGMQVDLSLVLEL